MFSICGPCLSADHSCDVKASEINASNLFAKPVARSVTIDPDEQPLHLLCQGYRGTSSETRAAEGQQPIAPPEGWTWA